MVLDYPSGLDVTIAVYKRKVREVRIREGDVTKEENIGVMCFQDEGRGHLSRNAGSF